MGKRIVPFRQMFEDDGRWVRTQGYYGKLLEPWLKRFPDMGVIPAFQAVHCTSDAPWVFKRLGAERAESESCGLSTRPVSRSLPMPLREMA